MNYYISYSIILTDFESMYWLFCSLNRQITNYVCTIVEYKERSLEQFLLTFGQSTSLMSAYIPQKAMFSIAIFG